MPPTAGCVDHGVVALLRSLRLTTLTRLVGLIGGTLTRQDGGILLAVPVRTEAGSAEPEIGQTDRDAAREPAHVLLIEDGTTGSQVPTLLLMRDGHKICRVADAEAALFACRSARHDLVIVDVADDATARQTSLEALRRLQAAQIGVPVLLLGELAPSQDGALSPMPGVTRSLAKPFAPDALVQAVAACRGRRGERTASAASRDARTRDALVQALGAPSVERLTGQLLGHVETLIAAPSLGAEAKTKLIELAGSAGILGLPDLAAACATADGAVVAAALSRLRGISSGRRSSAA